MKRIVQFLREWKRPLQAAVAVTLLSALYWAADWRSVAEAIRNLDGRYLLLAAALFIPQTVVSAWRWTLLIRPAGRVAVGASLRATLAAAAYNLLIPSKLGDVSKLSLIPGGHRKRGMVWLVLEKGFDVAALLVLIGLGLLGCGWMGLMAVLAAVAAATLIIVGIANRCCARNEVANPSFLLAFLARFAPVACSSAVLWCLHLLQIDLFCKACGVFVPGEFCLWRIPLAVFAGLVPFTLWGLGTRDAALAALFAGVAPTATMATVGLLTATRYLIPGAIGIPFVIGRRSTPKYSPAVS